MNLNYLAVEVARNARSLEPQVTQHLQELANANGAQLKDLDTMLKTKESIVRKMNDGLRFTPSISENRLKRRVNDALRYTVVIKTEDYAQVVQSMLEGLREKGYEVSDKNIRNSWSEEVYKGINCTLSTHGGTHVFEVQFHTDQSLQAKHAAHPLYEQRRSQVTSPEARPELDARMRELFGRIPLPSGVGDIGRRVVRRK